LQRAFVDVVAAIDRVARDEAQPGGACGDDLADPEVEVLRRAEPDELPLGPGAAAMHRRVDAPREGRRAGKAELLHVARAVPVVRRVDRLHLDARTVANDAVGADLRLVVAPPAGARLIEAGKRKLDWF